MKMVLIRFLQQRCPQLLRLNRVHGRPRKWRSRQVARSTALCRSWIYSHEMIPRTPHFPSPQKLFPNWKTKRRQHQLSRCQSHNFLILRQGLKTMRTRYHTTRMRSRKRKIMTLVKVFALNQKNSKTSSDPTILISKRNHEQDWGRDSLLVLNESSYLN